ncbi:flagellar biosynthesis regulator FlaF [Paracoccus methylarcula]|uniref:Flagellar biosynthesis regulatory protein FlaF n=1 Tax=Paracoccus methylarcula TaxID=72022 RepID=A0A422QXH7_9RHOB|nr:flagellar biosynthesis regulator FlaF [Paracoccus methylarcula]RNF34661.1 flagellar biosynthesis regulatory protein FlaF [Paracoccus methylarcula]
MNALASDYSHGYGNNPVRSDRDTEYAMLSRVTSMLRRASASGDIRVQIEAVGKNNQLWTILAADLASEGNALPDDLRARLLSLASFSLRHGHAVLVRKATVNALIDVNMSIMKGLRGEAGA